MSPIDETISIFTSNLTSYLASSMHSVIGPRGVAFSLSAFSTIYQITSYLGSLVYRTFGAVIDEFSTNGNIWVFLNSNTQPLPYKFFAEYPVNATWFYNRTSNTLYEALSPASRINSYVPMQSFKLPWIMSLVSCMSEDKKMTNEWYLDDWASTFFMATDNYYISPKLVLACWSINSGVWFSDSDTVRLEIIDKNGEKVVFNNINASLSDTDAISWRKVLGLESTQLVHSDSGSDEHVDTEQSENDEVNDGNDENYVSDADST